tara:strand:+ start:2843 stop:3298 length:456 start_codon:yes stop_codon:yes gene_type:complete
MGILNGLLIISGVLGIIWGIFKFIFSGNKSFFKILDNFIKQLPPNKDKVIPKLNKPLGMFHLDVGEVKTDISKKELNIFLKELEDFNYNSIYLKRRRIKEYSRNIQRIINTNTDISDFNFKFTINNLQTLFDREKSKPYLMGNKIYQFLKI